MPSNNLLFFIRSISLPLPIGMWNQLQTLSPFLIVPIILPNSKWLRAELAEFASHPIRNLTLGRIRAIGRASFGVLQLQRQSRSASRWPGWHCVSLCQPWMLRLLDAATLCAPMPGLKIGRLLLQFSHLGEIVFDRVANAVIAGLMNPADGAGLVNQDERRRIDADSQLVAVLG